MATERTRFDMAKTISHASEPINARLSLSRSLVAWVRPGVARVRKVLLVLVLGAVLGCQHVVPGNPACSGEIVRDRLPATYSLHVRAALDHEGSVQRHEAWLEVSPEMVTLVGLTPLGTQAYSVQVDASGTRVDDRIGRRMGLDARLLLDAVARAWVAPRGRDGSAALASSGEALEATSHTGWRYLHEGRERARVEVTPESAHVASIACGYVATLRGLPRSR